MASRITDLRAGTIPIGGAPYLVGVIVDGAGSPISATGSGGAVSAYTSRLTDLRASTITVGAEPYIGLAIVDGSGNQITSFGGSPGGSSGQIQFNSSSTFAGDANLTWDATTGLALGKKLTITGGTVTDPAIPLTITQTWNDAADTFDAADINITATAAAAASRLLRLRASGVDSHIFTRTAAVLGQGSVVLPNASFNVAMWNGAGFGWSASVAVTTASTVDAGWYRDGVGIVARRDGTNAQKDRLYNTFSTVNTAGEWWKEDWQTTANQFRFGTVRGSSSGTARAASWDYGGLEASPTAAITVPITGGNITFGGPIVVPASTTSLASLNVPHGSAPTSPVDGDIWTTTAGLYVRINGATVGPLS